MSTPEKRVKAQIKKVLDRDGVYFHMPVQNGMGAPSLDFIGCRKLVITPNMVGLEIGEFFAIETKAGNKQPTARQERTIEDMEAAGAYVFVVNEVAGMDHLKKFVEGS